MQHLIQTLKSKIKEKPFLHTICPILLTSTMLPITTLLVNDVNYHILYIRNILVLILCFGAFSLLASFVVHRTAPVLFKVLLSMLIAITPMIYTLATLQSLFGKSLLLLIINICAWIVLSILATKYHKKAIAISNLAFLLLLPTVSMHKNFNKILRLNHKFAGLSITKNTHNPPINKKKYIWHIILDSQCTDVFRALPPSLKSHYDNFILYQNNTTPYSRTRLSVPTALSGKLVDIKKYKHKSLEFHPNYLSLLANNGHSILAMTSNPSHLKTVNYDTIFYDNTDLKIKKSEMFFYDLSVFIWGIAYDLAPYFFNYPPQSASPTLQSYNAIKYFTKNVEQYIKTYNHFYIYSHAPRYPHVLDQKCNPVPLFSGNIRDQTICIESEISQLIKRIKELKIFNKSIIFIHGDHGVSSDNFFYPTLLYKPFQKKNSSLTLNSAKVSLLDIVPTIFKNYKIDYKELDGFPLDDQKSQRNLPQIHIHRIGDISNIQYYIKNALKNDLIFKSKLFSKDDWVIVDGVIYLYSHDLANDERYQRK